MVSMVTDSLRETFWFYHTKAKLLDNQITSYTAKFLLPDPKIDGHLQMHFNETKYSKLHCGL